MRHKELIEERGSSCAREVGLNGSIIMLVVVLAYYALNWLTPEYHEDFIYKFIIAGGLPDHQHPIHSIGDIIQSQVDHYYTFNGRSIVHFIVQLFTGILGKQVFNVVNIIVFAAFILLMRRNLTSRSGSSSSGFTIAVVLVMTLLLPRFKDTFLWMSGSINYLWSSTMVMAFLLLYEGRRQQPVDKSLIWILPFAFIAGWTHEGISMPLALSLVFFNLPTAMKSYRQQGPWMALVFLGGACMTALAPGIISRSGADQGLTVSSVGLKVITGFIIMGQLKVVYLALLSTIASWFIDRYKTTRIIRQNNYLLMAALLSCAIVFLCGVRSPRSAFGLELFAMIYLLRLLGAYVELIRPQAIRLCTIIMTIGLVAFYSLMLRHAIPTWQESQRLINQITQTHGGIIGTHEHQSGIFSNHIGTMLTLDSTASAVNFMPSGWARSIAATYHCDSLVFLPQTFLDDLKLHSEKYERFDLTTSLHFFVQHLDGDEAVGEIYYKLSSPDYSTLPFILRPIARRMHSYNLTSVFCNKWAVVTLYGKRYLIVKRDHDYDDRLLDIQIIHNNKEKQPI